MSKITLDVNSKNIDTVLMILSNLKPGLITSITTDKRNNIISKQNEGNLKQEILKDEFMKKPTSTGKYLSKDEYKYRIQKKG